MNNKDKNGIERRCKNCKYHAGYIFVPCMLCGLNLKRRKFKPSAAAYEARICELQARVAELEAANKDLNEGVNISYQLGRRDGMRAKRGKEE